MKLLDPLLKNKEYVRSVGEVTIVFCTKYFVMIKPPLPLANKGKFVDGAMVTPPNATEPRVSEFIKMFVLDSSMSSPF